MNDEILYRMDLKIAYEFNKIQRLNNNKYYVYLISNNNVYYVGLSKNINKRLDNHIKSNTNNINDYNTKVYILECLNYEKKMRIMEYIWILWFKLNANCINIQYGTYKLRIGRITKYDIKNTNYEMFCNYDYINKLYVYDRQHYPPLSDEKYINLCKKRKVNK